MSASLPQDNFYHMECASLLTQKQRRSMNFTDDDYAYLSKYKAKCQASLPDGHPAKITKRAVNSGTFYVITLEFVMPSSTLQKTGQILTVGLFTAPQPPQGPGYPRPWPWCLH